MGMRVEKAFWMKIMNNKKVAWNQGTVLNE